MHPAGVGIAVVTPFEVAVCELGSGVSVGQNKKYGGRVPSSSAAQDASGGRSCTSLVPRCTGTLVDACVRVEGEEFGYVVCFNIQIRFYVRQLTILGESWKKP
jgi:hypothetical protein